MNDHDRVDSRFSNFMQFFSFIFMMMAIAMPYFQTDTLYLMFATAFLLLAGMTQLLLRLGLYLGNKQNAIIEQLKIANEIPILTEEDAVESEEPEIT